MNLTITIPHFDDDYANKNLWHETHSDIVGSIHSEIRLQACQNTTTELLSFTPYSYNTLCDHPDIFIPMGNDYDGKFSQKGYAHVAEIIGVKAVFVIESSPKNILLKAEREIRGAIEFVQADKLNEISSLLEKLDKFIKTF